MQIMSEIREICEKRNREFRENLNQMHPLSVQCEKIIKMAKNNSFIFTRKNYSLILVSICLLVSGFLLMTGKGNAGAREFNQDIYSFRRITVSPLILLSGYAMMIYAIMAEKSKSKQTGNGDS